MVVPTLILPHHASLVPAPAIAIGDTVSAIPEIKLPRSVQELTAEWLGEALRLRYPGVLVNSVTFGHSVRATGTKVRLLLDYNDAGHRHRLPATMWFKGGLEQHSANIRTSHVRESLFYHEIAPLNLVNAPASYFAGAESGAGFGAQLIEDLLQRNARFGTALTPLTLQQAREGLSMLARMHAHWWMSPKLEQLGPTGGSLATDGIVLRLFTPNTWEAALRRPEARELPRALHDLERVCAAMESVWAFDRQSTARCMVHGDPHPGNLFFEQSGTPGFLDWQRLMQCDWAHDVAYFLISSLDVADSAAAEQDLLREYLRERDSLGVPSMTWEDAWNSYRLHAVYGLVWNVVPTVMQKTEVVEIEARRFNAAAERLNVVEVLNAFAA